MGSVRKVFKKVTKAVKKPVSKITKGIAKGIAKVGKAVIRGVAKINKKLGPLGTIALSMAMPYALQGLGQGFATMAQTQATGPFSTFIKSIGQMGVNVGNKFNAISGQISKGFSNITSRITKSFSNIGKGNNIFSRISNGVKNLYTKAKTNFGNTFGKKATAGKVEVFSPGEGPMLLDVDQAAKSLKAGTIQASDLGTQTAASKSGWFTKSLTESQLQSQQVITDAINKSYADTLSGYSNNAMRFFTDVKKQAIAEGTYINDYQVGELLKNNGLNQNVAYKGMATDFDEGTRFLESNFDIANSKNYKVLGDGKGYEFTGNEMFKTPNGTSTISKRLKESTYKAADSLLSGNYKKLDELPAPYMIAANQDMTMQTSTTGTGGTNIEGSGGGTLIANAYGNDVANDYMNYYKKMNILANA